MATMLAPVDSREVVRCDQCHLVQFRTTNNLCRRCKTSLDPDIPPPVVELPPPLADPVHTRHSHLHVAPAIRMLRQQPRLTQRQPALRLQLPHHYESKIQHEQAIPTP